MAHGKGGVGNGGLHNSGVGTAGGVGRGHAVISSAHGLQLGALRWDNDCWRSALVIERLGEAVADEGDVVLCDAERGSSHANLGDEIAKLA